MKNSILVFAFCLIGYLIKAQSNIVTYVGNEGKETFYDVTQITNGTFLVCGSAQNLDWIDVGIPRVQLSYSGNIPNSLGTNRFGFILQLAPDLQTILHVLHFPQGAVEDIRFIKTNSQPYKATGDLFISCNTADTDNNNGGYIIAKLNNNFVNGIPSGLSWLNVVWAKSGPKDYHPWDVNADGTIYYISGEAHGYDWSAIYSLNPNGQRRVVPNWRTHWLINGSEWKGTPASANPLGSIDSVKWSGIALKIWGRCELRSWTTNDFNTFYPDGNGGMRKGKWPADVFFNSPCDPANPTATGPGYSGYSAEACCPVWGGSCIAVDRRTGNFYIGMNFKSYFNPQNTPDFEPAVIAMDSTGNLLWWSRLYHEITPQGDTVGSIPDQYVDALAIDYANDKLVVGSRAHGNNVENFWEGNTVNIDVGAFGFQNQFTGTNGNIHESWLGKLRLSDGVLTNSSYLAELAEATGGLGTPHADPNLDGWPDPNTGWPNVNTTRIGKNAIKVSSNGDVCLPAVGRRTITTADAYQKMPKPSGGGLSCWNSFIRMYDSQFHVPKYSSLVVGVWDTLTQAGGDNTEIFGIYKTSLGIVAVGRQKADTSGNAIGNNLPLSNVPTWGVSNPQNETAILVYYQSDNLKNNGDNISTNVSITELQTENLELSVYPNPSSGKVFIWIADESSPSIQGKYIVTDAFGRNVMQGILNTYSIDLGNLSSGIYQLQIQKGNKLFRKKVVLANN